MVSVAGWVGKRAALVIVYADSQVGQRSTETSERYKGCSGSNVLSVEKAEAVEYALLDVHGLGYRWGCKCNYAIGKNYRRSGVE